MELHFIEQTLTPEDRVAAFQQLRSRRGLTKVSLKIPELSDTALSLFALPLRGNHATAPNAGHDYLRVLKAKNAQGSETWLRVSTVALQTLGIDTEQNDVSQAVGEHLFCNSNDWSSQPCIEACCSGNIDIVKRILDKNLWPSNFRPEESRELMKRLIEGEQTEMLRLLVDRRVITPRDRQVAQAARTENWELCKVVLRGYALGNNLSVEDPFTAYKSFYGSNRGANDPDYSAHFIVAAGRAGDEDFLKQIFHRRHREMGWQGHCFSRSHIPTVLLKLIDSQSFTALHAIISGIHELHFSPEHLIPALSTNNQPIIGIVFNHYRSLRRRVLGQACFEVCRIDRPNLIGSLVARGGINTVLDLLDESIKQGATNVLTALCEREDIWPAIQSRRVAYPPLFLAVYHNNLASLRVLLAQSRLDLTQRYNGRSAFEYAISRGNLEIVNLFLENMELSQEDLQRYIYTAITVINVEAFRVLLGRCNENPINANTSDDRHPLFRALSRSNSERFFSAFLDSGYNPFPNEEQQQRFFNKIINEQKWDWAAVALEYYGNAFPLQLSDSALRTLYSNNPRAMARFLRALPEERRLELIRDEHFDQVNNASVVDLFLRQPWAIGVALCSDTYGNLIKNNLNNLLPAPELRNILPDVTDHFAHVVPALEGIMDQDELVAFFTNMSQDVFVKCFPKLSNESKAAVKQVGQSQWNDLVHSMEEGGIDALNAQLNALEEHITHPESQNQSPREHWSELFQQTLNKMMVIKQLRNHLNLYFTTNGEVTRARQEGERALVAYESAISRLQLLAARLPVPENPSYKEQDVLLCMAKLFPPQRLQYALRGYVRRSYDLGLSSGADLEILGLNLDLSDDISALSHGLEQNQNTQTVRGRICEGLLQDKTRLNQLGGGQRLSDAIDHFCTKLRNNRLASRDIVNSALNEENLSTLKGLWLTIQRFYLTKYFEQSNLRDLWGNERSAGPLRRFLKAKLPEAVQDEMDCLDGLRIFSGLNLEWIDYYRLNRALAGRL